MKVSARQLRERWIGEEKRVAAIVTDLMKGLDWTGHLWSAPDGSSRPIKYVDECRWLVWPGEAGPRDLRGVVLRDLDLNAEVTGLANAYLDYATFDKVHFAGASLIGSSLRCATFLRDSSLHGVKAHNTSFEGAICRGISFMNAELFHANLCGCDLRDADLRGTVLTHALITVEGTFGFLSVRRRWTKFGGLYQTMKDLHPDAELYLRKHIATCSEIRDLHDQHPRLAWIWYWLANYGRSAGRLAVTALLFWLFFAITYLVPEFVTSEGVGRLGFDDAMYLSAVTITTLGYGDIVPANGDTLARFLVVAEAVSGVVIMGAFISVLIQNATITPEDNRSPFTNERRDDGVSNRARVADEGVSREQDRRKLTR